jgi:aspartyl-tRNA(Asn)/glutamyl-tRNA(Gln) amidotransferase subunit A
VPEPGSTGAVIVAAEAFAWHRALIARRRAEYDPRVLPRIESGAGVSAADYLDALAARLARIAEFDRATRGFDAVLAPSVAVPPPRFDELQSDEDYRRINALVLRNTSVFNLLDRCALSIPCSAPDELPVGLMVVGETGGDHRLLAIGQAIESVLE